MGYTEPMETNTLPSSKPKSSKNIQRGNNHGKEQKIEQPYTKVRQLTSQLEWLKETGINPDNE